MHPQYIVRVLTQLTFSLIIHIISKMMHALNNVITCMYKLVPMNVALSLAIARWKGWR